ncbi:MAG TPA: TIGR01777 family oxidoreductase [Myxococcota bacterium]|nr:TIGR01777 family oxidoreductase [Myxococcota bacterium]
MARIALSGASGLVGARLAEALGADGHRVLRLVRGSAAENELQWDPARGRLDPARLAGLDAFIHLSGERVAGVRWTAARKQEIAASRVASTTLVAETIARLTPRPALLCASAIGYYGDRGGEWLEETSPAGQGFLADVCAQWERACEPARAAGARVVNLRLGVVLDPNGGALAPLALQHRLGLGGRVGPGTQWVSWITSADVCAAARHILVTPALVGAVNLVAPQPVTNAELSKALARALHRPAVLPLPAALLRLALGEAADGMLLASQRVRPAKLLASGFRFQDPELEPALRKLLA